MKRLLPSGPLTEHPIPARGRDDPGVEHCRPGPGLTSVFEIKPSENMTVINEMSSPLWFCIDMTLVASLTVLMVVCQVVSDERGHGRHRSGADEAQVT